MDAPRNSKSRQPSRSTNLQQRPLRVDTMSNSAKASISRMQGESSASRGLEADQPQNSKSAQNSPAFAQTNEYAIGSPTAISPDAGPSTYREQLGNKFAYTGRNYSTNPDPSTSYSEPPSTSRQHSKRSWSKSHASKDHEAGFLGSDMLDRESSLTFSNLMRSKLARTILSAFLIFSILALLSIKGTRRQSSIAPTVTPTQISEDGTGSWRDARYHQAHPERIPHSQLTELTSSLDPTDMTLSVSVLFIPQKTSTAAQISSQIKHFQHQSRQPVSYHLPDSVALPFLDSDLNVSPISSSVSNFTLTVPLSGQPLEFGPSAIHYLLHLAHTKEFSGALLELGCAQSVFLQTSWVDKVDLITAIGEENHLSRLAWQKSGLSALQVAVEDRSSGENDGFWINGILQRQECGSQEEGRSSSVDKRGHLLFMIEGPNSWEDGWRELACQFVEDSAALKWDVQAVIFSDEIEDMPQPSCGRYGSLPVLRVSRADWLEKTSEGSMLLHVTGAFVDHSLRLIPEEDRPWVAIGLPLKDLPAAVFLAALDVEALSNWHLPQVNIVVITNNRPVSLERLLDSLKSTHYFGDTVQISISMEQTADPTTHRMIRNLDWKHGPVHVRHRIMLGGLMPAIVESWYPSTDHTYGVFLEDDVEVSPLFYAWLKFSLLQYRYTASGQALSKRLFGISLYQPKNVELRPEGRMPFDAHNLFSDLSLPYNSPYLSQVPCSWGAAYFPEAWREFHQYLSLRLSEHSIDISTTIVPDVRSNRWPRSWKKYFIEMVYLRGYLMLYPNYPDFESFSTNHLEMGTHVHVVAVELKKKLQFTVPLMTDNDPTQLLDLPNHRLPGWPYLPVLDLWGGITTEEEAIHRGYSALLALGNCAEVMDGPVYDLTRPPTYDAEELLCRRVFEPAIDLEAFEKDMQAEKDAEALATTAAREAETRGVPLPGEPAPPPLTPRWGLHLGREDDK